MASSQRIEWQAFDRKTQSHSPDWYWAVSIIALSITVTAALFGNTLFGVLVVISTVVLFLRSLQKPQLTRYELTSRGLWIEKGFYPFTVFESFWVTDLASEPKLIMKSKGLFTPLLAISLGNADPDTTREFLQEFLFETEMQEPLSKRIMEYFGF